MLLGRQLNFDDYGAIVRRRLWVLLIPALLGPVVAYVIARYLPPRYTSNSLILIEQPKVPTSFVPSVVGNDLTARLANMEEQILSRTRLEPLIERYGLYRSDIHKVSMEELVTQMRQDISVTPVSFAKDESDPNKSVPGIRISFTASNPQSAQAVCSEITSMFVDENLRLRESRAQGTATFIAMELQQAKQKLDAEDARLAAFKEQHFGSLPDQERSTVRMLGTLSAQLNSLTDALGRYQDDRTYTESLLTQQTAAWKASQTGSNPQTLQQKLAALENHLATLRTQYTEDYPDVVSAKRDIAKLKSRIAQQQAADASSKSKASVQPTNILSEPPEIERLRAQLNSIDAGIKENEREQAQVRGQINFYEAKLKLTPTVEQQYKDITRNYQTALAFYNSLLAKENESEMSTNLERRQEGEQFQVLDPADLPQKPSFPDKVRFAAGGLAVGLLLGAGVALLLEMKDKALRDDRDVEFFLGVPTLALVPSMDDGRSGQPGLLTKRHKLGASVSKLLPQGRK
ncbi:MAG TPA: Wzz/FepE/Etk N-terminal domain-containing protein [Terriglobia bacterium]|nr:Wzz/FepE/Etk N-terminal domain-containing protein [Terriglobia bacterium]